MKQQNFKKENHKINENKNNGGKISFYALGGLDERGKNCFVLEINQALYIFDAGIMTPSFSKFGIKKIIFDYTWIQKNLNKVKALFVGVANVNNIGALQFLNSIFKNIPIYTSKLGKIIINNMFNEKSMQNLKDFSLYKVFEVDPLKPFMVGNLEITAFQTTSISPQALGFCLKTDQGYIIVIDEFIISPEKNYAFQSQLESINAITKNDNLLLITAAGNISGNGGFTSPQHEVDNFFKKQLLKLENRLIIGAYDYNLYLIIKIIDLCTTFKMPIFITNSIYVNLVRKLEELKIIKPNPLIMNVRQVNEMKKGVILVIGNQNNMFKNLMQILDNESKVVKPHDLDRYLLAIKTIPGFEFIEAKTFDKIAYLNYEWLRFPKNILEVSPSLNDHLFLLTMLKPKYVIPIKGLHFNFIDYSTAASDYLNSNQIISLDNGQKISFQNQKLVQRKPEILPIQEKLIGSHGLNNVEDLVLIERKLMSENGVILLNVVVNKNNQTTEIKDFKITAFGITIESETTKEPYQKMLDLVKSNIIENFHSRKLSNKELKIVLKKIVSKYFNKLFQKTPIVLPSIIDISLRK